MPGFTLPSPLLPFACSVAACLPADVNAFLYQMEENIADFAQELGCAQVERRFRRLATDRWACLFLPACSCPPACLSARPPARPPACLLFPGVMVFELL